MPLGALLRLVVGALGFAGIAGTLTGIATQHIGLADRRTMFAAILLTSGLALILVTAPRRYWARALIGASSLAGLLSLRPLLLLGWGALGGELSDTDVPVRNVVLCIAYWTPYLIWRWRSSRSRGLIDNHARRS
jgi:hypothetical protein